MFAMMTMTAVTRLTSETALAVSRMSLSLFASDGAAIDRVGQKTGPHTLDHNSVKFEPI